MIEDNGRPEGCISEQFVYFPALGVYPDSSEMNELAEIPPFWTKRSVSNGKV